MSTTWFTSDEHYGHANIIWYCNRPFRDLDDMTEGLIARFNERVAPEDLTYHLGDFALDERLVPKVLQRLNGRHRLVVGNHDRCHPCHAKWRGAVDRYLMYGFEEVCTDVRFCQGELENVLLCHMPYSEDERHATSPRRESYARFRPDDDGKTALLHGHVHTSWRYRPPRQLNVGVDVWDWRPISAERVLAELRWGDTVARALDATLELQAVRASAF